MNAGKFLTASSSIAIALALCAPATARADWAYTRWGMTPQQVVAASAGSVKLLPPAKRTQLGSDDSELAVEGTYTEEKLVLPIGFTFNTKGGGLLCVMYNAFGNDIEPVRTLLVKRYGKPANESSFGPTRTFTWNKPDTIEMTIGEKPLAAVVSHCAPETK